MHIAIVGAGPIGAVTAIALARDGHGVTIVDRDPGPSLETGATWRRRGVMQFHHPHAIRAVTRATLERLAPDVVEALLAAGCRAIPVDDGSSGRGVLNGRRSTFEPVIRSKMVAEHGVQFLVGHVDELLVERGEVVGVRVQDSAVHADLTLVAAGRAGHLGDELRDPIESRPTGFAYVSKTYRGAPGEEIPDSPSPFDARGPGYFSAVFPHDAGTHSLLILRPVADQALADLRHDELFETAVAAIPNLQNWGASAGALPLTSALAGAELHNTYARQSSTPGVIFLGDAVITTNPIQGRGIGTGLLQVQQLVEELRHEPRDIGSVAQEFEGWAERELQPWYQDHVDGDRTMLDLVRHNRVDPEAMISTNLIVAAAMDRIPEAIEPALAYIEMDALPSILDPFRPTVARLLQKGWRPAGPTGPTRDELVDRMLRAA